MVELCMQHARGPNEPSSPSIPGFQVSCRRVRIALDSFASSLLLSCFSFLLSSVLLIFFLVSSF
jgi:hypothetical protein